MTWDELYSKIEQLTPVQKSQQVVVYPPTECPADHAVLVTELIVGAMNAPALLTGAKKNS